MGANVVYSALNYYFGINEMPIATSKYWNVLIGRAPGEILNDEEGMDILKTLATNMATLLKKLKAE